MKVFDPDLLLSSVRLVVDGQSRTFIGPVTGKEIVVCMGKDPFTTSLYKVGPNCGGLGEEITNLQIPLTIEDGDEFYTEPLRKPLLFYLLR